MGIANFPIVCSLISENRNRIQGANRHPYAIHRTSAFLLKKGIYVLLKRSSRLYKKEPSFYSKRMLLFLLVSTELRFPFDHYNSSFRRSTDRLYIDRTNCTIPQFNEIGRAHV